MKLLLAAYYLISAGGYSQTPATRLTQLSYMLRYSDDDTATALFTPAAIPAIAARYGLTNTANATEIPGHHDGGPRRELDGVTSPAPDALAVSGWAADPAAPGAPLSVQVIVTGPNGRKEFDGTTTGAPRPDVAAATPWAGGATGFSADVGRRVPVATRCA